MNTAAAFLSGSAWIALLLGAMGESLRSNEAEHPARQSIARWLWALGGAFLLLHIAAAFHLRHGWSHAAAVADTARQTHEFTGINWGGGVWFNYALAAVWVADAAWWWFRPKAFERARRWLVFSRLFFLFMWLNAAVVFVRGPMRWFGLVVCIAAVLARYGAMRMR